MQKPAWELRNRLIAVAVALSPATLQGCFFLVPIPMQKILRSGLNLEDEFDRVFAQGGGCTSTSLLRQCPTLELGRKYCQRAAEEFVKVVYKNRALGIPPKAYLLSKGGSCTETAKKRQWHCVVERVVTTTYCQNTPDPIFLTFSEDCVKPRSSVGRYVMNVDIHDPGGDIRADFEHVFVSDQR